MSRRKHQAAKTIVGKPAIEKIKLSEYGADYDEQLFQLVERWETLFGIYPGMGEMNLKFLDQHGARHWLDPQKDCRGYAPLTVRFEVCLLLAMFKRELDAGQGEFFRRLGNAIERYKGAPVDRLRHWLAIKFYVELSNLKKEPAAKGFEKIEIETPLLTVNDLQTELLAAGIKVDDHQLRRTCKEMEIPLAGAKRGRPKKQK